MTWIARLNRFAIEHPLVRQMSVLLATVPVALAWVAVVTNHVELDHAVVFSVGLCGTLAFNYYYQSRIGFTSAERARITNAFNSGDTTGNARLDKAVISRLERAVQRKSSLGYVLPVLALLCLGGPIAAAVRTGVAWWLLATLSMAVLIVLLRRSDRPEEAEVRLRRLTEQMSDEQPT